MAGGGGGGPYSSETRCNAVPSGQYKDEKGGKSDIDRKETGAKNQSESSSYGRRK